MLENLRERVRHAALHLTRRGMGDGRINLILSPFVPGESMSLQMQSRKTHMNEGTPLQSKELAVKGCIGWLLLQAGIQPPSEIHGISSSY